MRHQDTQNAKNAFVTFGTRDELVQALEMNNFVPYDGAMPMLVAPASAPPAGREGRTERRGGGGGFFDRDRERYGGDSGRDWSDVRSGAQQPSGGGGGGGGGVGVGGGGGGGGGGCTDATCVFIHALFIAMSQEAAIEDRTAIVPTATEQPASAASALSSTSNPGEP
jgi:hypothetical protein